MNDNLKQVFDHVAAALAAVGVVVDHLVSIVAGCLAIAWYVYRFVEARKAKKNGHVE